MLLFCMFFQIKRLSLIAALAVRNQFLCIEVLAEEEVEKVVGDEVFSPVTHVIVVVAASWTAAVLVPVGVEACSLYVGAVGGNGPGTPVHEDAEFGIDEPFGTGMGVYTLGSALETSFCIHLVNVRHHLCRTFHLPSALAGCYGGNVPLKSFVLPPLGTSVIRRGNGDVSVHLYRRGLVGRCGLLGLP